MADGAHAETEPEGIEEAKEEQDVGSLPLVIETVTRVQLGARRPWFPQCQEVDGRTFVTLTKNDPGLCFLVTGKGQNRHQKRDPHSLNVQWWDDARRMRQAACSALVKKHMLSALQEGEAPPRIRHPREDDKWVISRLVVVDFPEVEVFVRSRFISSIFVSVVGSNQFLECDSNVSR